MTIGFTVSQIWNNFGTAEKSAQNVDNNNFYETNIYLAKIRPMDLKLSAKILISESEHGTIVLPCRVPYPKRPNGEMQNCSVHPPSDIHVPYFHKLKVRLKMVYVRAFETNTIKLCEMLLNVTITHSINIQKKKIQFIQFCTCILSHLLLGRVIRTEVYRGI